MTIHFILHFLHVVGAVLVFAALGVELAVLAGLRRATTAEQALSLVGLFGVNRRLGPISMLLLLVPGIVMTATVWGWQAWWIRISFLGLIAIGAIGGAVTGRKVSALEKSLRASTSKPFDGAHLDPGLRASFLGRVGIAIGVVFIMTTKPELAIALGAIGAGASVGLVGLL